MTEPWPVSETHVVLGIDDSFNFMNFVDPANPVRLQLTLTERSTLVFTLSNALLASGWRFQEDPIRIRADYGMNFSSYTWCDYEFEGEDIDFARFKMVCECTRLGEYEYSLLMRDRHRQKITLDPKIKNGTGLTGGR